MPSCRHISLPGVAVHRGPLERRDVLEVDGIRCTTIARTLADLGRFDSREQVRIAFEWAWRSGTSLLWMRQVAERLAGARRRGPRMLLELVAEAEAHRRPTESALEVQVAAVIEQLPGIVRQHRVLRADGSFVGRVDFAIPELRIAIEAHSRRHHVGVTASEDDATRESELQAEGWIVRFVTDRQRRRPAELRASLLRLIDARRRTLGAPERESGSTPRR